MPMKSVVVASLLLLTAMPSAPAGTASSGERLPGRPEGADVWWAL